MYDSVTRSLSEYAEQTKVRFHMPGHKGRDCGALPFGSALPFDVTELEATDNLYSPAPDGVFREELDFMRSVYGTEATVLTAGGATSAIFAAFACCARRFPGRPVLCDRKAHLSVINALALTGLEPVWFDAGAVGTDNVETYKNRCGGNGYSAVFVTSPDYYGEARDVASFSELARGLGVPLIADNSHGAHLFFHNGGALHPLRLGASMVIDSLHKTLPALTGAALLHSGRSACFPEGELLSALRMFVSTSPSYLISSSACACVRELAERGEAAHAELLRIVSAARDRLVSLGYTLNKPGGDPFRICIIDGDARGLYDFLARNGVVCEFCDGRRVVLLASVRSTSDDFALLTGLCAERKPNPAVGSQPDGSFYLPRRALTLREALFSRQELIPLTKAAGRTAAAPAAPYPPGIPVIVPGEVYDERVVAMLTSAGLSECAAVAE